MLGFQEKRRWRQIMSSRITIAVLAVLIFFVARGAWGVYQKSRDSRNTLQIAQKAYAELEDREGTLSGQIAALKTERGVEEEIRSRYEVAKPGEEVALIVDDASTTVAAVSAAPSWLDELMMWAKRQ